MVRGFRAWCFRVCGLRLEIGSFRLFRLYGLCGLGIWGAGPWGSGIEGADS